MGINGRQRETKDELWFEQEFDREDGENHAATVSWWAISVQSEPGIA
jgi:hypothetical protein